MKHKGTTDNLVALGPLVQVRISPQPSVMVPGAAPQVVTALMRIDTGAQRTVIDDRIAVGMGLTPIRFASMVGVSGKPELCPVYPINITIGFADAAGNTAQCDYGCFAIGMNPQATAHQGLIGRDFLKYFELHYNGPKSTFEIIVPAAAASTVTPSKPNEPVPKTAVQRQQEKGRRKDAKASKRRNRK